MKNTGNGWEVTREEAIEKVGLKVVEEVESENCEWHSGGGQAMGEYDTIQTWVARISIQNNPDWETIEAVYFVDDSDFFEEDGEAIEDLSNIHWEISHYEIR